MHSRTIAWFVLGYGLAACSSDAAPFSSASGGAGGNGTRTTSPTDDRPEADAGADADASTDVDASPPQSRTIGFDDVPSDTPIGSQYPGVTFSTPAANEIVRTKGFGSLCDTSPPNTLQVGPAGVFSSPLTVEFHKPVSGLKFRIGCIQSGGTIVKARLTRSGGQPPVEVPVIPTGYAMWVDLSEHTQITKLELYDVADSAGLSYDDFTFVQ